MNTRPYKNHATTPAITIYLINDDAPVMDQLSCIYCKRTIVDQKGTIDSIINAPLPLASFGTATNVRCKLCKQNYRIVTNAQTVQG